MTQSATAPNNNFISCYNKWVYSLCAIHWFNAAQLFLLMITHLYQISPQTALNTIHPSDRNTPHKINHNSPITFMWPHHFITVLTQIDWFVPFWSNFCTCYEMVFMPCLTYLVCEFLIRKHSLAFFGGLLFLFKSLFSSSMCRKFKIFNGLHFWSFIWILYIIYNMVYSCRGFLSRIILFHFYPSTSFTPITLFNFHV